MRAYLFASLLLAGCGSPTVVRDRPSTISVPVIQKCASEKPADVVPLKQRISDADWKAMSVKQRAEITEAQGYRRMNNGDELAAATSAC